MITVKDLREFLDTHNIPDNAEVLFEDGCEIGVHITEIVSEKIGVVECIVLSNKDVAIDC